MQYRIAERFKSIQGEGVWAGTPMAFIRFVGCSVGKKVCASCDTDFDREYPWKGGGSFSSNELIAWAEPYKHICLTGGEPLDQNLAPLLDYLDLAHVAGSERRKIVHIETSGTRALPIVGRAWICVSPKPGFREDVIAVADEVKVIVPGLGPGEGWPTLEDALRWARAGRVVFLQPKNQRLDLDSENVKLCFDLVSRYPELRLSLQMHKVLRVP
jgi:organic radical activating enzyme